MVVLYSTGCPKCVTLENRLNNNGINFTISNDVDKLIKMGFQNAPILQIDNDYYEFTEAMKKLKEFEQNGGVIE